MSVDRTPDPQRPRLRAEPATRANKGYPALFKLLLVAGALLLLASQLGKRDSGAADTPAQSNVDAARPGPVPSEATAPAAQRPAPSAEVEDARFSGV